MHIHTVLSACGDWDNTPKNICKTAHERGLDIIAISDHNAIENIPYVQKACEKYDILVIPAIEITTREEVHLLGYFPSWEKINSFYEEFKSSIPYIKHNPEIHGWQVIVNENDEVVKEIDSMMNVSSQWSIDKCVEMIHKYEGIAVPAHIDRPKFSIIANLGFIPPDLNVDAVEMKGEKSNYPHKFPVIFSSDAHYLKDIGSDCSIIEMNDKSFSSYVKGIKDRKIKRCKGG